MSINDQIKNLVPEELHSYVDYASEFVKATNAKLTVSFEKKDGVLTISSWGQTEIPIPALETYVANIMADVGLFGETDTPKEEEEEEEERDLAVEQAADLKAHGARLDWAGA